MEQVPEVLIQLDPDSVARNARCPEENEHGHLMKNLMVTGNAKVEELAVQFCNLDKDMMVIEVGFGPGVGLKAAVNVLKDGSGKLYGIDLSELMVKTATELLQEWIDVDKIHLQHGSVYKLPYTDNFFNAVFHCNCFYFWDDMQVAVSEIHRVLKPNGRVVTTFNKDQVKGAREKGWIPAITSEPQCYIDALKSLGFKDISVQEGNSDDNCSCMAITAHK